MYFVDSCVLLLVEFFVLYIFVISGVLGLCIFVVGGVASAYMCGFIVDWVRLCFGFVC